MDRAPSDPLMAQMAKKNALLMARHEEVMRDKRSAEEQDLSQAVFEQHEEFKNPFSNKRRHPKCEQRRPLWHTSAAREDEQRPVLRSSRLTEAPPPDPSYRFLARDPSPPRRSQSRGSAPHRSQPQAPNDDCDRASIASGASHSSRRSQNGRRGRRTPRRGGRGGFPKAADRRQHTPTPSEDGVIRSSSRGEGRRRRNSSRDQARQAAVASESATYRNDENRSPMGDSKWSPQAAAKASNSRHEQKVLKEIEASRQRTGAHTHTHQPRNRASVQERLVRARQSMGKHTAHLSQFHGGPEEPVNKGYHNVQTKSSSITVSVNSSQEQQFEDFSPPIVALSGEQSAPFATLADLAQVESWAPSTTWGPNHWSDSVPTDQITNIPWTQQQPSYYPRQQEAGAAGNIPVQFHHYENTNDHSRYALPPAYQDMPNSDILSPQGSHTALNPTIMQQVPNTGLLGMAALPPVPSGAGFGGGGAMTHLTQAARGSAPIMATHATSLIPSHQQQVQAQDNLSPSESFYAHVPQVNYPYMSAGARLCPSSQVSYEPAALEYRTRPAGGGPSSGSGYRSRIPPRFQKRHLTEASLKPQKKNLDHLKKDLPSIDSSAKPKESCNRICVFAAGKTVGYFMDDALDLPDMLRSLPIQYVSTEDLPSLHCNLKQLDVEADRVVLFQILDSEARRIAEKSGDSDVQKGRECDSVVDEFCDIVELMLSAVPYLRVLVSLLLPRYDLEGQRKGLNVPNNVRKFMNIQLKQRLKKLDRVTLLANSSLEWVEDYEKMVKTVMSSNGHELTSHGTAALLDGWLNELQKVCSEEGLVRHLSELEQPKDGPSNATNHDPKIDKISSHLQRTHIESKSPVPGVSDSSPAQATTFHDADNDGYFEDSYCPSRLNETDGDTLPSLGSFVSEVDNPGTAGPPSGIFIEDPYVTPLSEEIREKENEEMMEKEMSPKE